MLTAFILYIWNVICSFCVVVETNIYTSTDKKCEYFVSKGHMSVAVTFNQYSCKLKEKNCLEIYMYRVWGHALEGSVVWTFHSQVVERLFWVPLLGYFRFGFVRSFFFYLVASAAVLYHCNIIWDMTVSYGSCSVWMYCLRIYMNGLRETIWKVQSCSVTGLHFFFYKLHSQLQFLYSTFMVMHETLIRYQ